VPELNEFYCYSSISSKILRKPIAENSWLEQR